MKKNIIKNIEAKAKPIAIIVLMVMSLMTAFFVIQTSDTVRGATVDQFNFNKAITIDSDQVPSSQTNIPICINITDSDLANKVLDSGWDIAFFDGSNNQLNHEIEHFNGTTGRLISWVNVTSLNGAEDTVIYMYYNDSDIGATAENRVGTWDSGYTGVFHCNDTDTILFDSTSNANHGTEVGSITYGSDGVIGDAVEFGNSINNYIRMVNDSLISHNNDWTMQVWAKVDDYSHVQDQYIISFFHEFRGYLLNYWYGGTSMQAYWLHDEGGSGDEKLIYKSSPDSTTFEHFSMIFDYESETQAFYNGNPADSPGIGYGKTHTGLNAIGCDPASAGFDGRVDELRFSNVVRSDDYLETCYNSMNNATDGGFFTMGSENQYLLRGTTGGYVTWSGLAGAEVWCNETGDGNEWLEVNVTANATTNITEFRIWFADMNETTYFINASNVSLYVSSDNSSYGLMGTFADGGNNISINDSTWNDGTMGANPFDGAGIIDKKDSIWLIFKLSIPADLPASTYYTLTATSCKIYIGTYT